MRLAHCRIIPARAGFTSGPAAATWRRRDHPRSRGVYGLYIIGARPGGGSSPLARGLQDPSSLFPLYIRIIPARAGFTEIEYGVIRPVGDHPRSRGVYATSVAAVA